MLQNYYFNEYMKQISMVQTMNSSLINQQLLIQQLQTSSVSQIAISQPLAESIKEKKLECVENPIKISKEIGYFF